jgi:hypothetical protein
VATFTKKILSGSSDGRGIKVVQTANVVMIHGWVNTIS